MNDDAGGGLRGTRALLSPALFRLLADRFGFTHADAGWDLGGSSNLNWFFADGSNGFVARVYRPYVTPRRLRDIQHVRRTLAQSGIPCPPALPTRDGETWATLGDRLVEVEPFIQHDGVMDTWERMRQGLPYLGRIHSRLHDLTVSPEGHTPRFANYLAPTNTLSGTSRGLERVRARAPAPKEQHIITAAWELARRVSAAEPSLTASLPRQLAHGDFWDNNVLFQGSYVALVTDWDFLGERARIDDLALSLYFAALTFLQDCPLPMQPDRLRVLVDAYDSGLSVPLTRGERAALPLVLARQPLWWIGFWLVVLDDDTLARQGFSEQNDALAWGLQITDHLESWQAAFA